MVGDYSADKSEVAIILICLQFLRPPIVPFTLSVYSMRNKAYSILALKLELKRLEKTSHVPPMFHSIAVLSCSSDFTA